MPRKRKAATPAPLIEAPTPVAPRPYRSSREVALASKHRYNLSCFQEAGLDWRLVYIQAPDTVLTRWLVGVVDYQCVTFDSYFATEFEATQRFHEILREWPK